MEIAIRYYSKLGPTKDITQAMAEEAGVTAVSIADEPSLQKRRISSS